MSIQGWPMLKVLRLTYTTLDILSPLSVTQFLTQKIRPRQMKYKTYLLEVSLASV